MNLEGCLTLTFVLATLHISVNEGQGNTCNINARPHSEGICGPRLSRAHSNLCFLLRQAYPEHFPRKRSVDSNYPVHKIYSLPLSDLAELDVRSNNWGTFLDKRESPFAVPNDEMISRDNTQISSIDIHQELSPDLDKALLHLAPKRGIRSRRLAVQSTMVCDCCYNVCTLRHLATYC